MKKYFLLAILLCIGFSSFGQITPPSRHTDSVEVADELIVEEEPKEDVQSLDEEYANRFVPRKASLYSAVLPGLGQAYNKRYWKVPIIYGGFIALGLTIDFYNDQYKTLRTDLFALLEEGGNTSPRGFSEDQLRTLVDKSRRERDFYIIMTGFLYLLQVAEAHIDAHLKEFQLNPQLKVSVEPMFEHHAYTNYNAGVSLKFKFQ